jgi:hypothetical protein
MQELSTKHLAFFVEPSNVSSVFEPLILLHKCYALSVAHRQAFSPLCPPALQHDAAIFSFHSFAKAVLAFSFAIMRLKGSFHHSPS